MTARDSSYRDLTHRVHDGIRDAHRIARRQNRLLPSNTPWEKLCREKTGQASAGAVRDFAVGGRGIAARMSRHNH